MKKILVTGALGGMGRAICKSLLESGYEVYGLDCRTDCKTDAPHLIKCDLTDIDSVNTALEEVKRRTLSLDAIVHTAGIYDLDSLIEMSEERFCRILDVNLCGVYRVNKTFAPLLGAGSRIIITTSELAPLDPLPFTGIYAVTKSALEKYAYSLRMETQLLGISVSVIRPGAVRTSLIEDSTAALDRFCTSTAVYRCNAERFKSIVDDIEAKSISTDVIAATVKKALESRHPRYVYNINRNFLLLLLNVLPKHIQNAIIKKILRP